MLQIITFQADSFGLRFPAMQAARDASAFLAKHHITKEQVVSTQASQSSYYSPEVGGGITDYTLTLLVDSEVDLNAALATDNEPEIKSEDERWTPEQIKQLDEIPF